MRNWVGCLITRPISGSVPKHDGAMYGYALNDIARSGVENMALDQRMLEVAAERQCVMLRVYRWSEPTLSLGYFQPYTERWSHPPSSSIAVVRRATGGGAIVHHYDWTYCIAVPHIWEVRAEVSSPIGNHKIGSSQSLYDCIHDAVVQWLISMGIDAQKWSQACALAADGKTERDKRAFLCFERRSCGDVVWVDQKVMGSAQRRIPGAVLQHGSLLLAPSPHAPLLRGLNGALDGPLDLAEGGTTRANTAEGFFKQLVCAVEMAGGIKMGEIKSLYEGPINWKWPRATLFAETCWTERR